jgi:hypothetical protein
MSRKTPLLASIVIAALLAALVTPSVCLAASAPPITAVQAYAVASQRSPVWTYIHPYQISTQGEGGAWVYVVTQEIGYGQPISATLDGYPGTQLTQYNQPIIQNGYIIGWYRYWYFQGPNLNGEFIYNVRSLNAPFTTKTAWIYVE